MMASLWELNLEVLKLQQLVVFDSGNMILIENIVVFQIGAR